MPILQTLQQFSIHNYLHIIKVVALAVHQNAVPAAPGGHQQAAGHPLVIAREVLIGNQEGHIPQQIGGKVPELLAGQLEDLDHLHLDGLHGLVLHQLLGMAGLEVETAVDRSFWQIFTSRWV